MGENKRIREIAAILRCQVPRQRAESSDIWEYPGEDWTCQKFARFVPPDAGYPVIARLGPRSLKFVLERYDIVIAISGTSNTIGSAAFVAEKPERKLISTKNFAIVRPDPAMIDPVWLYYRMARGDIRERLAAAASGDRSRYLPPDAVGELEIRLPDGNETESIHKAHEIFLEGFRTDSERREAEKREWEKLGHLMKG